MIKNGFLTSLTVLDCVTKWACAFKQAILFGSTGRSSAEKKNDMQIFKSRLMKKLKANEKVEADMGYQGMPTKVRHPRVYISLADKKAKGRARARHESINGRIKNFHCIGETFRHNIKKHKTVFLAAATVTQLCFDCGETPFQIKY